LTTEGLTLAYYVDFFGLAVYLGNGISLYDWLLSH